MTSKLIAIVSAATMLVSSAAEAGGGVRLGFGVPLGSFVATPAHGGGGGYRKSGADLKAAARHKAGPKYAAPKHAAPKLAARPAPSKKPVELVKVEPETTTSAPPLTATTALVQAGAPDPGTETATEEAPATTAPETNSARGGCTKFVPTTGTTVSVGCPD